MPIFQLPQLLHFSTRLFVPSVHKYIFPSEIALSAIVEVAELITKSLTVYFLASGGFVYGIQISPNDGTGPKRPNSGTDSSILLKTFQFHRFHQLE